MGIVYSITNTINGKVYIGKTTTTFTARYPGGKWWHYTHNKHLKCAVKEYGKESFAVKELFNSDNSDELSKTEIEWIEKLETTNRDKGYNVLLAEIDYTKANETKRMKSEDQKAIIYSTKSKAQIEAWASKTEEEMQEINNRRSETLLVKSKEIDFSSRVAKRNSRTQEEKEISEVKRIIDRFGPDWKPGSRSVWFNRMDRFHQLALILNVTVNAKPIVYIIAGQSGVGKSWICNQLSDSLFYIPSDRYKDGVYDIIATADGPVLFDPTVRSHTHVNKLKQLGYTVYYIVVWEECKIVKNRLISRGSNRLNNVERMNEKYNRYRKYADFTGTSSECLGWLKQHTNMIEFL